MTLAQVYTGGGVSRAPLPALRESLQRQRIGAVCVVSPHLDDAVLSLAEFLRAPDLPPREVCTLFTEARADSDARHAHATGFADPLAEIEARRREDETAMAQLGVPFEHAGLHCDRFTAQTADEVAARLVAKAPSAGLQPAQLLVLLPAGGGAVLSRLQRLWRRLTRQPIGSAPHGEHVQVRDALWPRLLAGGVRVGLYADIPYAWAEPPQALLAKAVAAAPALLRAGGAPPLRMRRLSVDPDWKLSLARCYPSQVTTLLGTKPHFQRKTVALPEALLLPFD